VTKEKEDQATAGWSAKTLTNFETVSFLIFRLLLSQKRNWWIKMIETLSTLYQPIFNQTVNTIAGIVEPVHAIDIQKGIHT
jgi:hypothetical protein